MVSVDVVVIVDIWDVVLVVLVSAVVEVPKVKVDVWEILDVVDTKVGDVGGFFIVLFNVVLSSVSPSHSLPLQFDVGIGPGCIFSIKATNKKESTRPTIILMDGFCFSVSIFLYVVVVSPHIISVKYQGKYIDKGRRVQSRKKN